MTRNSTPVPTIAAIPVSNNSNNNGNHGDPELALADANISSTRTNDSALLSASALPALQDPPRSLAVARAEIALSSRREEDSIPTALASPLGRSNNCSSSNNNVAARSPTTRQTRARTETNHHRVTTTDSERIAESDDNPLCYDRWGNRITPGTWFFLLLLILAGVLAVVVMEREEEKEGYSYGTDDNYHSPYKPLDHFRAPTTPFPTRSPTTARPTPTRAPTPRPTPAPTVFGYVGEIETESGLYFKPDYNESLSLAANYEPGFGFVFRHQECVQEICKDFEVAIYSGLTLFCYCLDEVPTTCLFSDEELAAARRPVWGIPIYSRVPLPSDCLTGREDHIENSSAPPSADPSSSLHTPSQQLPSSSISESPLPSPSPSQAPPTIAPSPK